METVKTLRVIRSEIFTKIISAKTANKIADALSLAEEEILNELDTIELVLKLNK